MSPVLDPVLHPEPAAVEAPPPLKLVASVMVGAHEQDRYLGPCMDHLLEFCDLVCIRWEGRAGPITMEGSGKVQILDVGETFYAHEGRARQELLDFTLGFAPTHVLAIDADEFVSDGPRLRAVLEADLAAHGLPMQPTGWPLCLMEVWNCTPTGLELREDGGWEEKDVAVVWTPGAAFLAAPDRMLTAVAGFTIKDAALASGRVPQEVRARAAHTCTALLHFGWASRAERAARHARYVQHDGGRFHNIRHLDSILLPDSQIELYPTPWPEWLEEWRPRIEAHAGVAAHDHKGFSEEKCVRCGWTMGQPALSCQNDGTPHRFPSQEPS